MSKNNKSVLSFCSLEFSFLEFSIQKCKGKNMHTGWFSKHHISTKNLESTYMLQTIRELLTT